jgi:hypothetical protein
LYETPKNQINTVLFLFFNINLLFIFIIWILKSKKLKLTIFVFVFISIGDPGWLVTFQEYFSQQVNSILNNVLDSLIAVGFMLFATENQRGFCFFAQLDASLF